MNKNLFNLVSHPCLALVAALAFSGLTTAQAEAQTASPPNIIHIVADDLGWTDLSSGLTNYGNGSQFYQTPNIDRLASEGMAFTSAYAVQTCVPTRVALMTGQYATRTGVYNVQSLQGSETSLLVGAANNSNIEATATTVGETLQSVGYATAHIGKFHVTQNASDITNEHGYDFNYGGSTSGGPGSYFATASNQFGNSVGAGLDPYADPYTQAYIDANLKPFANGSDVDSLIGTSKHLTDAHADAAIDFIDDRLAAGDGPFYMNLAFNAVHTPIEARPDLEAKYASILTDNAGVSPDPLHDDAAYAGLLEGMDQAIGRLLSHIEDPNGDGDQSDSIANNTVIFFYGDNGGLTGVTDNTPLRSGKGSQYEGGLRVPLIAWAPGRVEAGSSSDEPIHSVDFYPTFAELAGASLPDASTQPLDGQSLVNLLEGATNAIQRDGVYFHFPGYQGQNPPSSTVVLDAGDNRMKLQYLYESDQYTLYDLNTDIGESNDLADGDMTVAEYKFAARAAMSLRSWLDETGAIYPTVRANGSDVPPPEHLPAITFDLGAELDGLAAASSSKLGIELTINAVGVDAVFTGDAGGAGVASTIETGGANQRQRINGSLSTPEAVEFSFNADTMLRSLTFDSLNANGSESLVLSFVSGDNPFANLAGYDADGFTLFTDSLVFDGANGAGGEFTLEFGDLARDEIFLTAGTVLSITADPVVGGGVLLSAISIAEPLAAASRVALDYNLDGQVDMADYEVWRSTFGSTTDLRADGNADGVIDLADYTLWRDTLAAPPASFSQQTPEPATLAFVVVFVAAGLVAGRSSRTP